MVTIQHAESILVIIVSVLLGLFLLAGITILVMVAQLIKALRRIIEKAERLVESAEAATEVLRNASGPLALFKIVRNIIKTVERMNK